MMTTDTGLPVEFMLFPGSAGDVSSPLEFDFDLPPSTITIDDKVYNLYWLEDMMAEAGLTLLPVRKKNSKRLLEPWQCSLQLQYRQMVETTGSLIERKLPKSIHAVTAEGFELKVKLFVLGSSLDQLLK